jgi:AmmeMemoRadiSam system protein A
MADEPVDRPLNDEEQKVMLSIARHAIQEAVGQIKVDRISYDSPIFHENRGAFVTLHNKGALRGCIGFIFAVKPLVETVREMAVAAALRDPRFTPVDIAELPAVDIEISVLTPLREIQDISEIKVGEHGIYVQRGHNTGLLLPQVASEYNWDRETFLQQTCRKAGLAQDAWHDEATTIKIFSAQVFGEKQ